MATFKLTLEYDGGRFSGWVAQPGLRTVEGELEDALATVTGERPVLDVAGRTDAGVHARGQVVSFARGSGERELEPQRLARALNAVLAADVAVVGAELAPAGFSARRDARSRTYSYRVLARRERSALERGRALWWPDRCDFGVLQACAALVQGTHDFTAFTPTQTDHVRLERDVLRAEWCDEGGRGVVELWIEADTFMRHMVRVLVGTMLDAARGRGTTADFQRLLDGAPRPAAGPTAPPHGLYLASVQY